MKSWRVLRLCVVALCVAGCGGGSQPERGATVRPDVQRMLEYVADEGAPGVVALVRNRSGTWRVFGGKVLADDMLREMLRTVPGGEFGPAGLGIFRSDLPCGHAWGHSGILPGYVSEVLSSRDGSRVVVMAANEGSWTVEGAVSGSVETAYCAS